MIEKEYIVDTNCVNLEANDKVLITDVTIFELIKDKKQIDKEAYVRKLIEYLKRSNSEIVSCFDINNLNIKLISLHDVKYLSHLLDSLSKKIFKSLCKTYLECCVLISLILILKKNKTKIKDDTIEIESSEDENSYSFIIALQEFLKKFESEFLAVSNKIFLDLECNRMDEIGLDYINMAIEKYNQYSKTNKFNDVKISKVSKDELLQINYGHVSRELIDKIHILLFNYKSNKDKTRDFINRYIYDLFLQSGKFEFNHIADLQIANAAQSLNVKIKTEDKTIKRLFPELAI